MALPVCDSHHHHHRMIEGGCLCSRQRQTLSFQPHIDCRVDESQEFVLRGVDDQKSYFRGDACQEDSSACLPCVPNNPRMRIRTVSENNIPCHSTIIRSTCLKSETRSDTRKTVRSQVGNIDKEQLASSTESLSLNADASPKRSSKDTMETKKRAKDAVRDNDLTTIIEKETLLLKQLGRQFGILPDHVKRGHPEHKPHIVLTPSSNGFCHVESTLTQSTQLEMPIDSKLTLSSRSKSLSSNTPPKIFHICGKIVDSKRVDTNISYKSEAEAWQTIYMMSASNSKYILFSTEDIRKKADVSFSDTMAPFPICSVEITDSQHVVYLLEDYQLYEAVGDIELNRQTTLSPTYASTIHLSAAQAQKYLQDHCSHLKAIVIDDDVMKINVAKRTLSKLFTVKTDKDQVTTLTVPPKTVMIRNGGEIAFNPTHMYIPSPNHVTELDRLGAFYEKLGADLELQDIILMDRNMPIDGKALAQFLVERLSKPFILVHSHGSPKDIQDFAQTAHAVLYPGSAATEDALVSAIATALW